MSLYRRSTPKNPRQRTLKAPRLLLALMMAITAVFSYFGARTVNPITDETQYINLTAAQEIALGLQAMPQMVAAYGGLSTDQAAQARLDAVCARLVANSEAALSDWPFECHLLAAPQSINAFALPGGQLFITTALWNRLRTDGELAGVMAHEIGHVVARHGAARLARAELSQGLSGAAVLAAYDPNDPRSANAAHVAELVTRLVTLRYGREDELQSDALAVQLLAEAGYDPRALLGVMRILAAAIGPSSEPEFYSTHPNPENRIGEIERAIALRYPDGIPAGLDP